MKNIFNLAKLAGVSTIAIGTVLHQYGTSYEDVCEGSLGSNVVSNFTEAVTGQDVSSAGRWYSVKGGAVCDAVSSVEGTVVKVADRALTFVGG